MQVQDSNPSITNIKEAVTEKKTTYSQENVKPYRARLTSEVARPYLQGAVDKPASIITPQTPLTEDLKNLFGPKLDEAIALYNLNPTPEIKKQQNQLRKEPPEAQKWIEVIQDMLPSNEIKTSPSILTVIQKILNKS